LSPTFFEGKDVCALIGEGIEVTWVYTAGQYQVRKELEVQQASILSQLGKPTKKPTLRWIFQKMSGIHRVHILGQGSWLTGLNEEKEKIIRLFGTEVCRVYIWFSLSQEYAMLLTWQVWRS
jgi:hypothetical protein